MVHENLTKKSRHSRQHKASYKKEYLYHLFDRLPQYLMSSKEVPNYLTLELKVSEKCT